MVRASGARERGRAKPRPPAAHRRGGPLGVPQASRSLALTQPSRARRARRRRCRGGVDSLAAQRRRVFAVLGLGTGNSFKGTATVALEREGSPTDVASTRAGVLAGNSIFS